MSAIDQIINVNISNNTTAVAQASFSVPLIMGPTATWTDNVHVYSSPAGMLTDGFLTSSPEYIYAQKMMSQAFVPTQFFVGKRATAVAQVDTVTVTTLTDSVVYSFTLNGVVISYNSGVSATQQSILTGLNAAITTAFPTNSPVTGVVSGSGGSAVLTLTSAAAGNIVTYTAVGAKLNHITTVAASGIATDLAAVSAQNDGWYGVCVCNATDVEILQAAAYIESVQKIFVAASSTTAIGTNATTDVASVLKAGSYKRTALIFSTGAAASGIDAAWLGGELPAVPGSNNWAYDNLAGITADTLTATQIAACIGNPVAGTAGKNANIYTVVGGVAITQMGITAGGQYLDITVGLDWLKATLQTNIYSALVNTAKIPYTDQGVAILISAVRSAIDQGVTNGLIDGASAITVTAPPVLSVSTQTRASRIAPTITFTCRLQGAVDAVQINGTVTI